MSLKKIKQFLKFSWSKIILTIILFLIHPEPALNIRTISKSWNWFAGIDILKNLDLIFLEPFKWIGTDLFIGEFFSAFGKLLLLISFLFVFYLISSFTIWLVNKMRKIQIK